MPFAKTTLSQIGRAQQLIKRISTALIGGDFSGNARGANAMDIQNARSNPLFVASGANAIAIGANNTASGTEGIAIGRNNRASGNNAIAIGFGNYADYDNATAMGYGSQAGINATAIGTAAIATGQQAAAFGRAPTASGNYSLALGHFPAISVHALRSTAIGYLANARLPDTTNLSGPLIVRKDNGEWSTQEIYSFSAAEIVIFSLEVDLKVIADQTIIMPTSPEPAGCKFWLNEIGIICTGYNTVTVQPTVRFGITGNLAKHLAAVITTKLTAVGKRERWTPLVPEDGETSLTAGVTVAATATAMKGRFYWKGILVEDE